jgi:hypothetical protein
VSVARAVLSKTANADEAVKEVFIVMTAVSIPGTCSRKTRTRKRAGENRMVKPT